MKKVTFDKTKETLMVLLDRMKQLANTPKLTPEEDEELLELFLGFFEKMQEVSGENDVEDEDEEMFNFLSSNSEILSELLSVILNNNNEIKFNLAYSHNRKVKKLKAKSEKGDLEAKKEFDKIMSEPLVLKFTLTKIDD